MKFIKQSSIDTVLEDVDIVKVIQTTQTDLKQKGANWFCLSPFTQEKSASLAVKPAENYFYDNSAGFGGNAITFLIKKHNISFFEAIEMAAQICNITLEYEEQSEDAKRTQDEETALKQLLIYAAEQFQKAYKKQPDTAWPREMAEKGRLYNEDTIQQFMIGYAPNEVSYLTTPIINMARLEHAKLLGLSNTKEGRSHDFFRDRLMFPIHNDKGAIVGFGGRTSNDPGAKEYAKYLNSKESKIYNKEKVLYGFWQAKKSIAEQKKAVLIEGYTDTISLHQAGLKNAVATCGTSLSVFHAKLLARVCKHVILFRDGDKAGLRAAVRDIDILLAHDFSVFIVIAPEGEDPDSLSRKCNINEFVEKNSRDAVIWKAELLQAAALNPDLENLKRTLNDQFEKKAQNLKAEMAPEEAFKSLSGTDKKFLKKKNDDLFKQISALEREMKEELSDFPKYDPGALSRAVEEMANSLYLIPNKIKQSQYVKIVARTLDQKISVLTQIITDREETEEKEKQARSKEADKKELSILGLPAGADKDQYLEDRFCEIGNRYHFHNGQTFFAGTNFRMTALFHVEGKMDNKRLCEVINDKGHKRLIDFESTDLINFTKIKERLIQEGFFFWEPGTTPNHFQLVAKKLLNEFVTATELKILGHQKQGFFAFADGVYNQGQFNKVNKYGIVHVEGL